MNKKIRWIIIGIVAVIIIAISIMAIINEVQLHYKVEEISEYKYFTLEQNQKYGVIDRNGNIIMGAICNGRITTNQIVSFFDNKICKDVTFV